MIVIKFEIDPPNANVGEVKFKGFVTVNGIKHDARVYGNSPKAMIQQLADIAKRHPDCQY